MDTIPRFLSKAKSDGKYSGYKEIHSDTDKLKVLTLFDDKRFTQKSHLISGTRMAALKVEIPDTPVFNLFPIHFHSKREWSDTSQAMECSLLAQNILRVENESKTGCQESIVMGDFNMNPSDSGMIAASGFHALPNIKDLKNQTNRIVDGTIHKFFYNPMWNLMGDKERPTVTFNYRSSTQISPDWHMFDQVILRPGLMEFMTDDPVKIVTRVGSKSLDSKYFRPNKKDYSDHFPLILNLRF